MRIAFDARLLDHPALAERGIGRYASSLLSALEAAGRDVIALRSLGRPPAPARIAELYEHALLGRDARHAGANVLHSPAIDLTTIRPGLPYVVTVHDLVPLKQPERYLRTGLKHRLRYAAVKRATRLIVPSRAVATDCEQLLGITRGRIAVIPEAPAAVFRPVDDPRAALGRLDLPEEFLLWVGGLDPPDPRKGIGALAAAAAQRDGMPLVLAGRPSAAAERFAAPGSVILTGRVSDDELAALYSAATALVFPSEDEGFGLPPVEALACGTPVAAFDIDAVRELEGVTLVEPGDLDTLLDTAESLAGTQVTRPTRTWADVADETWATYESAISS